jgi:hypothetical protein
MSRYPVKSVIHDKRSADLDPEEIFEASGTLTQCRNAFTVNALYDFFIACLSVADPEVF